MTYEYKTTTTPLLRKLQPGDEHYDDAVLNMYPMWRAATEEERQLIHPGPEWRLSNSFSDKSLSEIVCIWERVQG